MNCHDHYFVLLCRLAVLSSFILKLTERETTTQTLDTTDMVKHNTSVRTVRTQKIAYYILLALSGAEDTQTDALHNVLGLPVFHCGKKLAEYAEKQGLADVKATQASGGLGHADLAVVRPNLGKLRIWVNP